MTDTTTTTTSHEIEIPTYFDAVTLEQLRDQFNEDPAAVYGREIPRYSKAEVTGDVAAADPLRVLRYDERSNQWVIEPRKDFPAALREFVYNSDKDRVKAATRALRSKGYIARQNTGGCNCCVDVPEHGKPYVIYAKDDFDDDGGIVNHAYIQWDTKDGGSIDEIVDAFRAEGLKVQFPDSEWNTVIIEPNPDLRELYRRFYQVQAESDRVSRNYGDERTEVQRKLISVTNEIDYLERKIVELRAQKAELVKPATEEAEANDAEFLPPVIATYGMTEMERVEAMVAGTEVEAEFHEKKKKEFIHPDGTLRWTMTLKTSTPEGATELMHKLRAAGVRGMTTRSYDGPQVVITKYYRN